MNKIIQYKSHEMQEAQGLSGFSSEQIHVIKNLIARDLTDNELVVFLHNCNRAGLDPMSRQIYAIKRGGKMTIQAGIDGLRIIAERTGGYAPGAPTQFSYNESGNLVSATAFIKKMTNDKTWHEIAETSYLTEFKGNSPLWRTMPSVMLAKVSEARALRRAFPDVLCNIYSDDEMSQADNVDKKEYHEHESDNVEFSAKVFATKDQIEEIKNLFDGDEIFEKKVLSTLNKHFNCNSFNELTPELYGRIKKYILEQKQINGEQS